MPLLHKPHTVSIEEASAVESGGNVLGTGRLQSATVQGQLTPMAARQVAESWGIEIDRPHLLLIDLADRDMVAEGDWLSYGIRRFFVRSKQIWDAEPQTACAAFALEEMDS